MLNPSVKLWLIQHFGLRLGSHFLVIRNSIFHWMELLHRFHIFFSTHRKLYELTLTVFVIFLFWDFVVKKWIGRVWVHKTIQNNTNTRAERSRGGRETKKNHSVGGSGLFEYLHFFTSLHGGVYTNDSPSSIGFLQCSPHIQFLF